VQRHRVALRQAAAPGPDRRTAQRRAPHLRDETGKTAVVVSAAPAVGVGVELLDLGTSQGAGCLHGPVECRHLGLDRQRVPALVVLVAAPDLEVVDDVEAFRIDGHDHHGAFEAVGRRGRVTVERERLGIRIVERIHDLHPGRGGEQARAILEEVVLRVQAFVAGRRRCSEMA